MPRRYFDYPPQYHTGHVVSTMGSWFLALGLVVIFGNLLYGTLQGPAGSRKPMGGKDAGVDDPVTPVPENFREIPVITHGPYPYDVEDVRSAP